MSSKFVDSVNSGLVSLGRTKIKPVGPSTDDDFRRGNFSTCVLSMLRCMSLWLFVHGMAVYGGSADRDLRSQKLGANGGSRCQADLDSVR